MDVYAPSGRYENRLSFTFFATCIPVKYMAPQPGRQQIASGYVSPTDCWLTPQSLEPCRIGCRVHDRMLHIPLTQIVLDEPCVCALVGQGQATRMAQHVGMGFNG